MQAETVELPIDLDFIATQTEAAEPQYARVKPDVYLEGKIVDASFGRSKNSGNGMFTLTISPVREDGSKVNEKLLLWVVVPFQMDKDHDMVGPKKYKTQTRAVQTLAAIFPEEVQLPHFDRKLEQAYDFEGNELDKQEYKSAKEDAQNRGIELMQNLIRKTSSFLDVPVKFKTVNDKDADTGAERTKLHYLVTELPEGEEFEYDEIVV